MAEQKSPGLYPEEKRLMDNFEREGWRAVFIAIKGEENARLGGSAARSISTTSHTMTTASAPHRLRC
jgi:uncharacterized protein YdhG (YjbR/CyaY superfamily)